MSQQSLAERCFTAKSHISGLLSAMQERGWLRRENHPSDARAKALFLEPAGVKLAQQGMQVQAEVVRIMAAAINTEQLEQVQEAMIAVSAQLEAQLR